MFSNNVALENYIKQHNSKNDWFLEEINSQGLRVGNVINNRNYLAGQHKILLKANTKWKGEEYETGKIILQTPNTFLDFHTTFLVGKPLSLVGTENKVKEYNKIYRKFNYAKMDSDIDYNVNAYADVFEHVYMDSNGIIKSKLILPENGFPVYNGTEMIAFVEHWKSGLDEEINNYYIYYPNRLEFWSDQNGNLEMFSSTINKTGLPIHFHNDNSMDYNFGKSYLDLLIPLYNVLEDVFSKIYDAVYKLSLNPLAVIKGQQIDSDISVDAEEVGQLLNLEMGSQFDFSNAQIDYNTIKLFLDNMQQQLSLIAKMPSVSLGNSNVANVSETSLKLMYDIAIMKALTDEKWLRNGIMQRFEKIEILLNEKGITFNDDDYVDITFNYNIPVNRTELIDNIKKQFEMGAISLQTIIEKSEITKDVTQELERIKNEKSNEKSKEDKKEDVINE